MKKIKKIKRPLTTRQLFKIMLSVICIAALLMSSTIVAFADAKNAVEKLADQVFAIVKVVGVLVALLGMIMFGMSFQSHDSTQKVGGALLVAGGALIYFAEDILTTMGISY